MTFKHIGELAIPKDHKVLSIGVGMYEDKSTYVIIATDHGPYLSYQGKTRKLEPVKEQL